MAEIDHFSYSFITPLLAFAMSVLGSLLGLTCTVHARIAQGTRRKVWYLLLAAWAIGGTGIWVMHFIAMLGFGVSGTEIRYDVPITAASALLAVGVVAAGLCIVGLGRPHPLKIGLGGVLTGLGVASMHYAGMAAIRLDATIGFDQRLVVASVVIAVVASTVALWFAVTVRRKVVIVAASLLMGLAVAGMHYTGMAGVHATLHPPAGASAAVGSTVFGLLGPIVLLVVLAVIGLIYALLVAPTAEDRAAAAYLDAARASRLHSAAQTASPGALPRPGLASPPSPPGPPDLPAAAAPTTRGRSIPRTTRRGR